MAKWRIETREEIVTIKQIVWGVEGKTEVEAIEAYNSGHRKLIVEEVLGSNVMETEVKDIWRIDG